MTSSKNGLVPGFLGGFYQTVKISNPELSSYQILTVLFSDTHPSILTYAPLTFVLVVGPGDVEQSFLIYSPGLF